MNRRSLVVATAALTLSAVAVAGRVSPLDAATSYLDHARDDHAALARLVSQVPQPGLRSELENRLSSLGYHLQEADIAVHHAKGEQGYQVTWWGHARGYRSSSTHTISASSSSMQASQSSSSTSMQAGAAHHGVAVGVSHGASSQSAYGASSSSSMSVGTSSSMQASQSSSATVAVQVGGPSVDGPRALTGTEWAQIVAEIKKADWEDDKLGVIRSVVNTRWFDVDQVIDAMGLVSWSESKLTVAETMWPRVIDREQGYRLLSAVEWSADRDKLKARLGL